jgi:Family of unknown function (DUF5994)
MAPRWTARVDSGVSAVFRHMTVQGRVVVDSQDLAGSRPRQERHMTLVQARTDVGQGNSPPEHTPRLRLKPKAPRSGYVDGAWWPHSDDLAAELPDLLTVLSVRLGKIDRVMYNVDEWTKAPAKLTSGGRAVRLDGYSRQPAHTVEVIGLNRNRIALLVVSANTSPDDAHTTLMAAAAPSDDSTVDSLLMITPQDRETRMQAASAQSVGSQRGNGDSPLSSRSSAVRSV